MIFTDNLNKSRGFRKRTFALFLDSHSDFSEISAIQYDTEQQIARSPALKNIYHIAQYHH